MSKYLNAKQANLISRKARTANNVFFKTLYQIEEAACEGEEMIQVPFLEQEVVDKLQNLGYLVSKESVDSIYEHVIYWGHK